MVRRYIGIAGTREIAPDLTLIIGALERPLRWSDIDIVMEPGMPVRRNLEAVVITSFSVLYPPMASVGLCGIFEVTIAKLIRIDCARYG